MMRGGLGDAQARAFLVELLTGRIESLEDHPEGGWSVEVTGMDRCGIDVLPDHDDFLYCHVEINNESDEDEADYVETILQTRPPADGADGIIVECLYRRRLGATSGMGSIEGRVSIVTAQDWEGELRRQKAAHYSRTLTEHIPNLRYAVDGLDYPLRNGALPRGAEADQIHEQLTRLTRTLMDAGYGDGE